MVKAQKNLRRFAHLTLFPEKIWLRLRELFEPIVLAFSSCPPSPRGTMTLPGNSARWIPGPT
jgi:hypothetical protein